MASRGFVLTPPTMVVFVISVILAILALMMHYAGLRIAVIAPARVFDILAVAYLILLAGVLFRQI